MPGLTLKSPDHTESGLEAMYRDWLNRLHMEPEDVDCSLAKVKASSGWQWAPGLLYLTNEESDRLAAECAIDVSELYTLVSD